MPIFLSSAASDLEVSLSPRTTCDALPGSNSSTVKTMKEASASVTTQVPDRLGRNRPIGSDDASRRPGRQARLATVSPGADQRQAKNVT
jgi:hypothetical protein